MRCLTAWSKIPRNIKKQFSTLALCRGVCAPSRSDCSVNISGMAKCKVCYFVTGQNYNSTPRSLNIAVSFRGQSSWNVSYLSGVTAVSHSGGMQFEAQPACVRQSQV
jgi:hypothetical protein